MLEEENWTMYPRGYAAPDSISKGQVVPRDVNQLTDEPNHTGLQVTRECPGKSYKDVPTVLDISTKTSPHMWRVEKLSMIKTNPAVLWN